MQPLKANLHMKTKDMRVEVKISTYPLLSDVFPKSTMFPVMTTSPLNLLLHAAQLPASHITKLCTAGYHSVVLTRKKVPQLTFHLLTALHYHRTPWVFPQQLPSKSIFTICDDLAKDEEEEDFQMVRLDDDHWTTEEIPDRHLCIYEHLVPHSPCPYPCPYMDYTSTLYHDTFDLSGISEFKDLMTTSSDEYIPALDDKTGY